VKALDFYLNVLQMMFQEDKPKRGGRRFERHDDKPDQDKRDRNQGRGRRSARGN